eukprot:scaffold894_cov153-Cylindrotheca_fusiformis.AAC.15
MRLHHTTFLTLLIIAGIDAFHAPGIGQRNLLSSNTHSSNNGNTAFRRALKGSAGENNDGEEEVSEGSARVKAMLEAAKNAKGAVPGGRAIPNPFLNPPPPQPTFGNNIDDMSVEEQAAMLRQLMANQGGDIARAPPMKQKRTNSAGRPVGRNKDADSIANTADLYFAQLKRDSTVRTIARMQGDDDVADAVMQDEGINQLKDLIRENPYLKGQKEEERNLIEGIPDGALKPYFESDEETEEAKAGAGIRYKEVLKQRRAKKSGATATSPSKVQPESVAGQTERETIEQQPAPISTPAAPASMAPEPVLQASQPVPEQTPPLPEPVQQPAPVGLPPPQQTTVTSYADERRQKLRTFMGMLLKHRGGPGFGKGQLKGQEVDNFESLLQEVTAILRKEGMEAAPHDVPMMTSPVAPPVQPATYSAPQPKTSVPAPTEPQSSSLTASQVNSAIACIEGATTMYKNSPPTLRESILIALRAALVSAVDTCSRAAGINEAADYGVPQPGTASIDQVDGMIACIEGAVTMYNNCPDSLKKDVIVALRAALIAAVGTCNNVIGDNAIPSVAQQTPVPDTEVAPVAAAPPAATPPAGTASANAPIAEMKQDETPPRESLELQEAVPSPVAPAVEDDLAMGPDENSKILAGIYEKIKAASGKGILGLRSDLTSPEASVLADGITEMRSILMQELEEGIPEPEPLQENVSSSGDAGSSVSKYQEMLAKAKAQKKAGAL